jgi:predicted RNase H-like HicB family nuclease
VLLFNRKGVFLIREKLTKPAFNKMKNSYTVVVERDPESNWLVGEVVELPGCYTQAPDLPSLESNVREAISVYLKTASPEEPLPDFVGTWRVEVSA